MYVGWRMHDLAWLVSVAGAHRIAERREHLESMPVEWGEQYVK